MQVWDALVSGASGLAPREAAALQLEMAPRVERRDRFGEIRLVAGVDLSFDLYSRTVHAAAAVVALENLSLVDSATVCVDVSFPYVPGLLAFREVPAIVAAIRKLHTAPDLVVTDGHGLAHPRRFGLACHLGLALDLPTIGVAKSLLVGQIDGELSKEAGASRPLVDGGEVVGQAVRSLARANPIYVSIGHRVSLESALVFARRLCTPRRRVVAPVQWAHALANAARRDKTSHAPESSRQRSCDTVARTAPSGASVRGKEEAR